MATPAAAMNAFARATGALVPRGGGHFARAFPAKRPLSSVATTFSKERSKSVYEYGAHRSDAEARIAEQPVIMVDGPVALCDGGGGALGHPVDYIHLLSPDGGPRACQYCGLRYQMKAR